MNYLRLNRSHEPGRNINIIIADSMKVYYVVLAAAIFSFIADIGDGTLEVSEFLIYCSGVGGVTGAGMAKRQ